MALTAVTLKNLYGKPYGGKPEITDDAGLSVRVSPKGKVTFQVRYSLKGKVVRQKIGVFPEMSLREARNKRDEVLQLAKSGSDPRLEKCKSKTDTLREVIDYWYENYCEPNRTKPQEMLTKITQFIPREWMNTSVDALGIDDWRELFKAIANKNKEKGNGSGYALNIITELRSIIRYAVRQGLTTNTAFNSLRPGDFAKSYQTTDRYLSASEIGKIWRNIETLSMQYRNQTLLRCLMVFGCRAGEIVQARKDEFDFENLTWTVPKEHTKGKRKGIVRPIPDALVPYLKSAFDGSPSTLAFPSRNNPLRPPTSNSVGRVAERCANDLGLDPFNNHDWRRTLSTHWTDMGAPIHLSEKMLGHHMQGVLAVYNRSEMLEERRKWTNIWMDKIEEWAR
ncbi:tyrosine-type recombinase/integrase [Veronia pacifica]|uniref:Tyr recombinase domain-containing protein n=1 Tax=Veronia pacifica TaxID=1080227 RepID=A0A1C3E882_9GAMM|nr:site-specific integrase [Veronia pacifica]ODA29431.1 hypothetical protein A8L45_22180 [Veronia pacifica]